MSDPEKSAGKDPVKMGLISIFGGAIAYYSYFVNVSLGPVFWLSLLVGCAVVSFGTGVSRVAISGVRMAIKANKRNDWVGMFLSFGGIILAAIAIYRAIHALTNY